MKSCRGKERILFCFNGYNTCRVWSDSHFGLFWGRPQAAHHAGCLHAGTAQDWPIWAPAMDCTNQRTKKVLILEVVWGTLHGPRLSAAQSVCMWMDRTAGCGCRWPLPLPAILQTAAACAGQERGVWTPTATHTQSISFRATWHCHFPARLITPTVCHMNIVYSRYIYRSSVPSSCYTGWSH